VVVCLKKKGFMKHKLKLLTIKVKSFITGQILKKGNDGGYTWVGSKREERPIKVTDVNSIKPDEGK
jgi:hypothetical protein